MERQKRQRMRVVWSWVKPSGVRIVPFVATAMLTDHEAREIRERLGAEKKITDVYVGPFRNQDDWTCEDVYEQIAALFGPQSGPAHAASCSRGSVR